jgi:hypothetical protein
MKTAVMAAEPQTSRISGRGEARRAVKAGHTAIVTAPSTVQARCSGDRAAGGFGDLPPSSSSPPNTSA